VPDRKSSDGAAIDHDPSWTDEALLHDRLAQVTAPPSCAILDFDETLWLRNSTEEFLHAVRPNIIAAILLQILGQLKPWRMISRQHPEYYRDWIRIAAVLLFAPWSYFTWQRKAARLGPQYLNTVLLDAIRKARPGQIYVASYGFGFIVKPLLAAIDKDIRLVAAASLHNGAALRKKGKGRALSDLLGPATVKDSIVVTDNFVDRDLCMLSDHGIYVQWRDAVYRQAGLSPMLPLSYTARIKRPKERYVLHGILGYDYAVLWLAYALLSPNIVATSLAIGFYLLAFFAVYEIGYYENDRVGLAREKKPVVSAEFAELGHNFKPAWAWLFGIVLAAMGAGVQTLLQPAAATRIGELNGFTLFAYYWSMALTLLVVTRLTFMWFNSLTPRLRIVPMLILQVERTLGYVLMLAIDVAGAVLCVSHAIGRWVPYVIYRFGGDRRDFPAHIATLVVFMVCLPMVAIIDRLPITSTFTIEFFVITAYLVARAAKDLQKYRRTMRQAAA
jgi:phosphoserine phosphatase